jgi:DNA polymerase III delta prime subunit
MPVLSHEETLTNWFASRMAEAPVVVRGSWEELQENLVKQLAPKEIIVLEHEGKIISIEKVRKLIGSLSTTAPFGHRLVVIPDCDRLSGPAAAALLKTLEEPNTANRWLLTTKFPRRLLPTIRSRVQIVSTPPLPSPSGEGEPEGVNSFNFAERLAAKERRGLTEEELEYVAETIQKHLAKSAGGFRALLRLRDYYKIRAGGGNEKLAADMLLAAMMELEK